MLGNSTTSLTAPRLLRSGRRAACRYGVALRDEMLTPVLARLPNLAALELVHCDGVTAEVVAALAGRGEALRRLAVPYGTRLAGAVRLDDAALAGLEELDLSHCPAVADTALSALRGARRVRPQPRSSRCSAHT